MPIGLGLHVAIALFFAVHAVRNGQERYWLFVLFAFPLLGSVVYAIAIWLPGMADSREGRRLATGLRQALDPERGLRGAREAFDAAPTTRNRVLLADALVEAGQAEEAVDHYRDSLRGIHADDPDVETRLARALLEAGRPAEARQLLDALIARRPDFRSPTGHLVYARAVAAEGDRDKARHEFNTLVDYASGLEARAWYVEVLRAWGDDTAADRERDAALAHARRMPAHARQLNREWLRRIERCTAGRPRGATVSTRTP